MGVRLLATVVALMSLATQSIGEQFFVPGPRGTIYPGGTIQDSMLVDLPFDRSIGSEFVQSRSALIGRVAKRTLFSGQPIATAAIDDPKLIANGSVVRLSYERSGISIHASGQALQSARAGDVIRVRNSESGIVVTGVVTPSGTVVVGQ